MFRFTRQAAHNSSDYALRSFSARPLQACVLDFHALNRHADFEAQGGQTEYALTGVAAGLLDALDAQRIKVGLVLPRYPVQLDVARFIAAHGERFAAVVSSEDVAGFPADAEPLAAACAEMDVEPWQALAVASRHVETDYAPLLGAAKAARLFTCALVDVSDGVSAVADQQLRKDQRPMYSVAELEELSLLIITLNEELAG